MIILNVTCENITEILAAGYTTLRVYADSSETGAFATLTGTVTLVAGQSGYAYVHPTGTSSTWYKVAYYGSTPGESAKSDAQQGGTSDAYCTAQDVKDELSTGSGEAMAATYDNAIWSMCIEASRLIDRYKKLPLGAYAAITSEARYFFGSGLVWQVIDYAVSVSKVEVEETDGVYTEWTANTDYFLWPYNYSGLSEPIRRLEANQKSGSAKSVFTYGQRRVKVTGVFGISATPPDTIARACKIQAARWFRRAQQGWQDAANTGDIGALNYVKKLDPDVEVILKAEFPHLV